MKDLQKNSKGDIAFLSTAGSICFFIEDASSGKTMTPIGKMLGNMDPLKDVKSGDVFISMRKLLDKCDGRYIRQHV